MKTVLLTLKMQMSITLLITVNFLSVYYTKHLKLKKLSPILKASFVMSVYKKKDEQKVWITSQISVRIQLSKAQDNKIGA